MTSQRMGLLLAIVLSAIVYFALIKLYTVKEPIDPDKASAEISSKLRWDLPTSQNYEFDFNSSMHMSGEVDAVGQRINIQMSGDLLFQTLSSTESSASAGMRLTNVSMSISGHEDANDNLGLESPFRVTFHFGAVPTTFEFPAEVDAESRLILQNLIRTFQVHTQEGSKNWVVTEEHSAGQYEAVYHRVSDDTWSKSKHRFSASPDQPLLGEAEILSDETVYFDPASNWIVGMHIEETLKSPQTGGPSISISNRASLQLKSKPSHRVDESQWVFAHSSLADKVLIEKQALPSLSPKEARRHLSQALTGLDTSSGGRSVHIHQIRDLLLQDNTLAAELLQHMLSQSYTDRTIADLFLALELAGTKEAQAALSSIIVDANASLRDTLRAIIALAGVSEPEASTVATLWDTVATSDEQLSSTAMFALGSIGRTLNAVNSDGYAEIRDRLLSGAYASADSQQRADYTSALGNTRDQSLVNDVSLLLQDSSVAVRRAAASSLSHVGSAETTDVLLTQLQQEPNGKVRAEIYNSLTELSTTNSLAVGSLITSYELETEEKARFAMAGYLGKHIRQHPEAKPLVYSILKSEPSKRVRQRLAEAIATLEFDERAVVENN